MALYKCLTSTAIDHNGWLLNLVESVVAVAFVRSISRVLAALTVPHDAHRLARPPVLGLSTVHRVQLGNVAVLRQCSDTHTHTYITPRFPVSWLQIVRGRYRTPETFFQAPS